MDKWLCWSSMTIALVMLVLFALDLAFSLSNMEYRPFGGISYAIDVLCILASGVLFYLAFDAYRDVR